MSEVPNAMNDAEEDLARKSQAVARHKEQINLNQQETGVSIEKTVNEFESLKNNIEIASATLSKAYWLLDLAGWLAPIGSVIVYYAIYFYYGLSTAFAYGGLEIALPTALFLRVLIWTLRLQLSGKDVSFTKSMKGSIGGFIGSKFRINFQATELDERLSKMWNYAGRMISAVRSYVPGLDQYYDGQERIRGQRSFIRTLRNALNEYGFQIRGKAESYLTGFGPLTDTEPQWVEKATMDMSLIYGMPQVIFKLVFADYVNDETERKKTWIEIRNDWKVLRRFVKMILDSGRVPTEYIEKNLESYGGIEELISKVDPFSLNSFLAVYNIQYYEFAEEKDVLLDAVNAYRLRITTSTAREIKSHVPSSFEGKERLTDLFAFSSVRLAVHHKILEFLFYERYGLGASRQTAWVYLKQSEESTVDRETAISQEEPKPEDKKLLSRFVRLLLDRNLLDVPTAYSAEEKVVEYIVKLLAPFDDFTITQGQMKVLQSFAALESEKDAFLRTMSSNNIPFSDGDRVEFAKMLPIANGTAEILEWLVKRTKVPGEVLLLFYYDYTAQLTRRDDYFDDLKKDENKKIDILARELLTRKIISVHGSYELEEEDNISNLASYLLIAPKYDRIGIESVFSECSSLFRYSKLILRFLKEQRICREDSDVSFEKLLKEISQTNVDTLDRLRIATVLEIKWFSLSSFHLGDWLVPIALATLTAFLVQREDIFLSDIACRRVASVERAVKILYEYSWMNDEEQHKSQADRTPFAAIIERAMSGTNYHIEYFSEFQRGLASGFLFRRISDIPLTRLRHIDDQVSKAVSQMEYRSKLESHLQALGTFLQSELKSGIIMESLKMQLVSAYAITIPTGADVIRGVIDNLLPNICEELAKGNHGDSVYKDIFIKAETEETSIGRYTRIGVVPYNMGFNDFADRLRRAYRIAVSRYKESGEMRHEIEKYVANVIRIFPTDAYFKQLEPIENLSGKGADEFLADLIRPLMLKKFGPVRSAEIRASLKTSEEDKVAMRSVLAALYDTSSALYLIARNEFDGVTSSPTLREHIKLGRFDLDLASAFEGPKLSELAVIVYRSARGEANQKATAKQNLTNKIKQICDAIRARPVADEIESVSSVVFQALYDIGMVLDGLSAKEG